MTVRLELKHCPGCGGPIPAESPQGLCPKCLMRQAAAPTEAGESDVANSAPPGHEELAAAFPQLEILELVGQGGMGFVYKARQPNLDRFVALKILPQSLAADPAFAARFTREGRVLARLNHPNIVTIHDFGQANGFFYLLMEFVDGVNLRQAMKTGKFTPSQALTIVPRICEALQFAHSEGILHRDIKPENILLDSRGRVKIADFGIAKLLGGNIRAFAPDSVEPSMRAGALAKGQAAPQEINLTEKGKVVGTPHYMAPEQLEHPEDVDQRADIYSLGVVFYEMLTGELPVGRFAPPSKKSPVDPRLDEVVLHALEKERERRTRSAAEVKTQVETITGSGAGQGAIDAQAGPASLVGPARSWRTRLVWIAGTAALLLITGLAVHRYSGNVSGHRPTESRRGTYEAIAEIIRNEVGRQLREAGATYEQLEVTRASAGESATPFKVHYYGLQNFDAPDGTTSGGNGEFGMEYIGAGQWQGRLGGKAFTVLVASRDNIDLPFVNDPEVVGQWESVDFVPSPTDFAPDKRSWNGSLYLPGLTFLEGGKTKGTSLTWTKGMVLNREDKSASHYEIRQINGQPYLFFEWKSGDVTILGRKPYYYVLKKKL